MRHLTKIVSSLVLLSLLVACSIRYTFSGASIPEHAKTLSVAFFPNQADYVNPNLSQTLTEYFKEFFSRQTRLELVDKGGDFHFEGEIEDYNIRPMAIQNDASAAETRLTIRVNVRCYNKLNPDKDFEQSFSAFSDFESSQSLQNVEAELVDEIINQISEDVFNKAFTDW